MSSINRSVDLSLNRATRTETILKLIEALKSDELAKEKLFQQVELTALEAVLKDDLGRLPRLQGVINFILSEGLPISRRRVKICNDSENLTFSSDEFRDLKEEVNHVDLYCKQLRKQMDSLQERYSKLVKMKNTQSESRLITSELRVKNSFQELRQHVATDSTLNDHFEVLAKLVERMNDFFDDLSIFDIDSALDELALASYDQSKEDLLIGFYKNLIILLKSLKEKLETLNGHCENLKTYFKARTKGEILWRKEIGNLLKEFGNCPPKLPDSGSKISTQGDLCWKTVEKVMEINKKYYDYSEKLTACLNNVKNLIDLHVSGRGKKEIL